MARSGASGRRAPTTTTPAATTTQSSTDATAATAPTTRVGRSRPCYGNPPRQTEDPLSPPCIATIFEDDNGGATATGVSATEIRVGVPIFQGRGTNAVYNDTVQAYFDYFNRYFELYGRRLVPVPVEGDASSGVNARAYAATIAAQNVFAVVNANQDWGYPQPALPQTLANAGIVTIVENLSSWWSDRTMFDPLHPFIWSIYPSSEDIQANLASFACTSLAGQPAAFAGDTALRSTPRKFGILSIGMQTAPNARVLSDGLAACTNEAPESIQWVNGESATSLQTAMARLRSAGVTTLFCVCESVHGVNSGPSNAHQAGFHPEWVFTPSPYNGNSEDEPPISSSRRSGSLAPPIRISAGPRLLPMQARPWFQALQSIRPDLAIGPNATQAWQMAGFYYEQLLVLASGLQAAGPNLSAETFAAGLMATPYSNPGAGQPPYWQPSAGFGPSDHSFYDDYSIGWWSDAAPALNAAPGSTATGSWCYVGQGSRFRPGTYPAANANVLFNPDLPCR